MNESQKERALSLITDENINEKEITAYSKDLMSITILDEDIITITSPLLEKDSFEFFSKESLNIIQIRNNVFIYI